MITGEPRGRTMHRVRFGSAFAVVAMVLATIAASAAAANPASVLNGVYRISWTEKEVRAAGASRLYAHNNFGYAHGGRAVLTMTLRDGQLRVASSPPLCHGTYSVSGSRISIKEGPGCQGRIEATWTLRDGLLRFHISKATDPGDRFAWGVKPWKKIG
jgi:hypothetical protein